LLPNGLGGAFQPLQGGVVSTDQKVGPEQILSELFLRKLRVLGAPF